MHGFILRLQVSTMRVELTRDGDAQQSNYPSGRAWRSSAALYGYDSEAPDATRRHADLGDRYSTAGSREFSSHYSRSQLPSRIHSSLPWRWLSMGRQDRFLA